MALVKVRNGNGGFRLGDFSHDLLYQLSDEVLLDLFTLGDISHDIWREKSLDAKILDPVHTTVWTVNYYCIVFPVSCVHTRRHAESAEQTWTMNMEADLMLLIFTALLLNYKQTAGNTLRHLRCDN